MDADHQNFLDDLLGTDEIKNSRISNNSLMSTVIGSYRTDLEEMIFNMKRDIFLNKLDVSIVLCTPTLIGTYVIDLMGASKKSINIRLSHS